LPEQFFASPTAATTIVLQEMEFVIFGHQVLHRGTRNEYHERHGRVFGSFETKTAQGIVQSKVCRKDLTSQTHFLEERFWSVFEKCEESYRK
jgi:hypothetical protein